MTKKDHALSLAQKGFWVFPLIPNGKLPLWENWQEYATRDAVAIDRMWQIEPNANIGIFTSRYQDDQALVVIDEDNKDGRDGAGALLQLDFEGYTLPGTFTQETPTGGRHHVFVSPTPVKQGTNVIALGLDVRSRGGFIVGAGSTIKGTPYRCNNDDVAGTPGWLFERLSIEAHKPKRVAEGIVVDTDRAYRRAMDYITSRAPVPQAGGRNDAAFKVAAEIKDYGNDETVCLDIMFEWNNLLEEPLEESEIELVVSSAYKNSDNDIGSKSPENFFTKQPEPAPLAKKTASPEAATADEPAAAVGHPLADMNIAHAFVIAGGGHHILWETTDVKGRFKLEHLNEQTFHRKYAWRMFQYGQKAEALTKAWITWEHCRRYDGLVFAPGVDVEDRYYNMWRGFSVEPLADGEAVSPEWTAAFLKFQDHALNNVCAGNAELFNWLMGYFAHLIQKPGEKPLTALVFKGSKGVGKNALVDRVAALLGNHAMTTAKRRYLMSNFNGHMESMLMFTLDEAYWSGDKEAEGVVKDLITGSTHTIERKGMETYDVDNLTRVVVIGNEDWLVPATDDERRYAVFNVGDGRKQDRKYFTQMRKGMEAGGYRLLLRYFMDFDLSTVDVNAAPNTQGLADQKVASLEPVGQWWLDCLHNGELMGAPMTGTDFTEISTAMFRNAFQNYMRSRNIKTRLPDERSIGHSMRRFAPSLLKKKVRDDGYVYYCTGGLTQLRQDFEKFVKGKVAWETVTEELECLK